MNKTLAEIAYTAYGRQVGWTNHLGKPMPSWDDLPARIQAGWDAAVGAAAVEIGRRLGQTGPSQNEESRG